MVKQIRIQDAAQLDRISRLSWEAPYEIYLHAGPISLDARDLTPAHMDSLVNQTVRVVAGDHADPVHFCCLMDQIEGRAGARRTLREHMSDLIDHMEPRYGWEIRLKRIQC